MFFSIIITSFNTREILKNCLVSIFSSCGRKDFEIIVVDNNSSDGSAEMLNADFGQRIKLIANKKNIGFGPANNQGAKIASGEYLFFLNSDTIIKEDILTPIKEFFLLNPEVGIIGPGLILPDGTSQKYAYGRFPGLVGLLVRNSGQEPEGNKSSFTVDWVSGAALAIRKNVWGKIGGFDENFFMYFEDIDLCKRAKNFGFKTVVLSSARLIHLGGKSVKISVDRKKMYYDSQGYFFRKHYGKLKWILLKIMRWPYKLIILTK
ncbi:MAG: glycosyltransferase family 2 protein [Patescibacteria group bacterium]|nr:glycosyltransferase family 2 protein [Patescibacteria group bacterium]MDD5294769.1 glycosyltransferase family 2 protein [Patescibacteria group bacterium]MDD5554764.1 glycosyltransferase family 2 protein [Patescibacteria group bacterium]